jgi:hypothetical protein
MKDDFVDACNRDQLARRLAFHTLLAGLAMSDVKDAAGAGGHEPGGCGVLATVRHGASVYPQMRRMSYQMRHEKRTQVQRCWRNHALFMQHAMPHARHAQAQLRTWGHPLVLT